MDWTAADWIGVIGGATGLLGGIAGVAGFFTARKSNEIAEGARGEAKAANQLSAESNLIALEANSIAVDANKLSEEANSIAVATNAVATERHDVDWDASWPDPQHLQLTNGGEDEARGVRAAVYIDGQKFEGKADVIGPGEALVIPTDRATDQFVREAHGVRVRNQRGRAEGSYLPFIPQMEPHFFVNIRVVWQSTLGQQHIHEPKPTAFSLDDLI